MIDQSAVQNDVPSYKERKKGTYPAGSPEAKALELPLLNIAFDPKTQSVMVLFDPEDFRSWEMVIGVLEMAKLHAQTRRAQTMMMTQQMEAQRQMQAMAEEQRIAGLLRK